jgi:hypothetical protein
VISRRFITNGRSATWTAFGQGCAGLGARVPLLAPMSGALPRVGALFTVAVSRLPVLGTVLPLGMLGFSRTQWLQVPLPLDLSPFGWPGCDLLVSLDVIVPLASNADLASWQLGIPADLAFVGQSFYQQGLIIVVSGTSTNVLMSNGGEATVGVR